VPPGSGFDVDRNPFTRQALGGTGSRFPLGDGRLANLFASLFIAGQLGRILPFQQFRESNQLVSRGRAAVISDRHRTPPLCDGVRIGRQPSAIQASISDLENLTSEPSFRGRGSRPQSTSRYTVRGEHESIWATARTSSRLADDSAGV